MAQRLDERDLVNLYGKHNHAVALARPVLPLSLCARHRQLTQPYGDPPVFAAIGAAIDPPRPAILGG